MIYLQLWLSYCMKMILTFLKRSLLKVRACSELQCWKAPVLSYADFHLWVCFDFGCSKSKSIFLCCVLATRFLQLSSQPSLISICSNVNFSPVSSPKSFSHMTIKRSQIMIKAHVLGLTNLCSPFWFPLDKLPMQGLEFLFLFLSLNSCEVVQQISNTFPKHSPKNSSDLLTN